MNQIINNIIIIFCFVIIVSSYKDRIKIVKHIILYVLFLISELLLMFFIYYNFDKWIYIILKLLIFYVLLKLIYKSKTNIIDIFYIMYLFLIYEILKISITNIIIVEVVIIVFSVLCKKNEVTLKKINYRVMCIWNEKSEKSLTLRCSFVIIFNLSFYIICKMIK